MRGSLRQSPLHAVHVALGATIVEFAGWSMPLRYGSELAEHRAVRSAAGVFDLSHMAELVITGPGAGSALDYALVGQLSSLRLGQARYTMACNEHGGIIDDLVVYRRGDEEYLVVANAANAAVVHQLLSERAAAHRCEVSDRTDAYALVALQGPLAALVLSALTDARLDELTNYTAQQATVLGWQAMVARTGYTGEDGFELFVPPEGAAAVFDGLLEAGAGQGVLPAGLAARDSLRLEAGMPLYGNELDAQTTPYEAGLGRVVRLDKPGDFVGRQALARAGDEAPRRRLVGLIGDGRSGRTGYGVHDPGGQPVGTVTSGAPSPTLGRPIAMAYVDASRAEPGTHLVIDVRGRPEPVEVCPLPFYRGSRPPARRPTPPPVPSAEETK